MSDVKSAADVGNQANLDTVRKFITAWAAKDFKPASVVKEFLASDAVVRFMSTMPPLSDQAVVIKTWEDFRATGYTLDVKIHSAYARGPVVVVHRTDTAHTAGQPDVDHHVVGFFAMKDGKIIEWTDYIIKPA
jgi:limonene-1,2-epoxide hydrolase